MRNYLSMLDSIQDISNKKLYFLFHVFLLISILFLTACSQKQPINNNKGSYTSKARHKATMRSYVVKGRSYHPHYVEVGQTMKGISSWYGPNFHGKQTSSGEVYNMYAKTAAHKTWPMDTMVKVTNLQNGRQCIVRINDRGPFVNGRVIDCSYQAGKELGLDKSGIAQVRLEVIGFAGKTFPGGKQDKMNKSKSKNLTNYGLQIGAFNHYSGATIFLKKHANFYSPYKPMIQRSTNSEGITLYRVMLIGFSSEQEANDFKVSHALDSAFMVRK